MKKAIIDSVSDTPFTIENRQKIGINTLCLGLEQQVIEYRNQKELIIQLANIIQLKNENVSCVDMFQFEAIISEDTCDIVGIVGVIFLNNDYAYQIFIHFKDKIDIHPESKFLYSWEDYLGDTI